MFRKLALSALFLLALCGAAAAQGCGTSNPNCIVPTAPPGTSNNQAASTAFVQSAISTPPAIAANSDYANFTALSAPPTAYLMPSCSVNGNGLQYTSGTGITCQTNFLYSGGPLGTPSSGTLTNTTGLPISTGVAGLGTGVSSALGIAVGSAGSFVTLGGALGTPLSGTATNLIGLPVSGIAAIGANTVIANVTGASAIPTAAALPSCSALGSALIYTSATGLGCYTSFASLTATGQTVSGGANVTSFNIGTVSSGTTTISCGNGPLQYLTNNGAFTLAAPASDGSCMVQVTNGATAGAITFSGFTVNASFTGGTLTTTNGNKFMISINRINASSIYQIIPQQ